MLRLFKKLLVLLGLTVSVTYVVTCGWIWRNQESLFLYPDKRMSRTPKDVGLDYQDLYLQSADGVRLHGWSIPPREEAAIWVLYCHGNSGNVSHRLEVARLIHEVGVGVLAFDYRGYGLSQGQPHREEDLQADGQAFLDWLLSRIPAERVVVFGESLGGGVACDLAVRQKVGGLVLLGTFASFTARAQEAYPYLPVAWLCRYRFDSRSAISRIDCPKLILHSSRDEINGYQDGQALYLAARAPRQFVELKGSHSTPDMEMVKSALQGFHAQLKG